MGRTFVIGVGMTKFEKPGAKEGLPGHGAGGGDEGPGGRRDPLRRRRGGLRRLLLRRLDLRPARRLRPRPDRHPGRQRQQQLLHRLLGAVPGAPGGAGRAGRVRARVGLREDGEGLAGGEVHRPDESKHAMAMFELCQPRPRRPADVRQRRARAHGALRVEARPLRVDRLEEPQALGQQPLRAVPGRVLARGHQGGQGHPRAPDQAPVLAHVGRVGVRGHRLRALRRRARLVGPGGGDRRAGAGHRHGEHLRGPLLHQDRRLRHEQERPRTGRWRRRRSASRTSTSSSSTTASPPTSSLPTRRSAWPRRVTATSSWTPRTRRTAAAGWSTPRAA